MNTPIFTPPGINPEKSIWLSGAVPSSKNSKEIGFFHKAKGETSNWFIKKNGEYRPIQPTLRSSDQTEEYIKHIVQQIIDNKKRFKELVNDLPKPYIIELFFVRKTKAMFDWQNPTQCISDAISGSYWKKHPKIPQVVTQWIEGDDIGNVLFIPPLREPFYAVDKDNPGVWLTVIRREPVSKPVGQIMDLFPNHPCNK